jgi:Family of unknown function (DUF5677)
MPNNRIPDKNTLCSEFFQHHSILPTPLIQRELSAIYWIARTKLEVDHDLVDRVDTLNQADPLWALLKSMLDRIFEYIEGAMCAYVTGSTAAAEIISRTTIESSVNLLFILVDSRDGSHLTQYLSHYFSNEEKEIDRWLDLVDALDGDVKRVHTQKATEKRTTLISLNRYIDQVLAELKLPTTEQSVKKWPNIAERFKFLGLELDYRTVYAALCSQTHNDAEDLLNYFVSVSVSLGDRDLLDKVGLGTVHFSRLMLYVGIKYYILAAGAYAVRFQLKNALDGISKGRSEILKELEKIANELGSET